MAKGPGGPDLQTPPSAPVPTGASISGVGQANWQPSYQSFLPRSGNASAQLGDKPYWSGPAAPPSMVGGATASAYGAKPGGPPMAMPQLGHVPEGSMRGNFAQIANSMVDRANANPSLGGYLQGRDQLARLMQLGQFRRGHGGGGNVGNRAAASRAGPASNAAGMGGLSVAGGLY